MLGVIAVVTIFGMKHGADLLAKYKNVADTARKNIDLNNYINLAVYLFA